jgi:hypothetical protein
MSELTHYVYFDKRTGRIVGVSNEAEPQFEHAIQVSFDEVEGFLSGRLNPKDYLVGYKRNAAGDSVLAILLSTDLGYAFKNNIFEWITETTDTVECLVTWNGNKKTWNFEIDKHIKDYYDVVVAPKLVFFVTLENDFDFLVRTIFISLTDLVTSDVISIPFTSNIENKIDKISISSKLVFKSYGLRIQHEN